jgi:hypothetical protein
MAANEGERLTIGEAINQGRQFFLRRNQLVQGVYAIH